MKAKSLIVKGVTVTVCGAALLLMQAPAHADATTPNAAPTVQTTAVSTTSSQNAQQVNAVQNYGYLDSVKLANGQLVASGWNATSASTTQSNHYVILYDQTAGRQLASQNVPTTARQDVGRAYPDVANSDKSGWSVTFPVNDSAYLTDQLSIISRYSDSAVGNGEDGHYTDFTYAGIKADNANRANLDKFTVNNHQLQLSGWHATSQSYNRPYHFIIVLANGKEVGRQLVKNSDRTDVGRVFPSLYNANHSGWSANFTLTPAMMNTNLQIISRYSGSETGNYDYVDFWFPTRRLQFSTENRGNLDSFNYSNGHVKVSGWHANNASASEPNHFLILFDKTTGRQVSSQAVTTTTRDDVARAFPSIVTAASSGFSADLGNQSLVANHDYALVSRYSTSNAGNGGTGSYSDYWFDLGNLNQSAYYIDSLTQDGSRIHVTGWLASNWRTTKPYGYVIILNNGSEVGRAQINFTKRNDVGRVYPRVYNSTNSGFNIEVPVNAARLTGKMSLILRLTDDPAGNGNYFDQRTGNYVTNAGYIDTMRGNGNKLTISGWHAASARSAMPAHVIIFLDMNGHELYRTTVNNGDNLDRTDVAKFYLHIGNAATSGFSTTITVPSALHNQLFRFIDRFATSVANDNTTGQYVDYTNGKLYYINNQGTLQTGTFNADRATYYSDANGAIDHVFNNANVISQLPELPTGCEMTAVTMMLQYAGVNINKFQVAAETPRSSNGDYGFVGNPYSASGWWVFPTGIAPVVSRHLGHSQVMTGASLSAIQQKLLQRHLVVVWMANMNGFVNHAITLTGFNNWGFTYNNPWTGRKESMSYGEFYSHWNADRQRALSY